MPPEDPCAASLTIPRRDRLSHPGSTRVLPDGFPPLGKIGQRGEAGIAVQHVAETVEETFFRQMGRATEKVPLTFLIVADEEDRMIRLYQK